MRQEKSASSIRGLMVYHANAKHAHHTIGEASGGRIRGERDGGGSGGEKRRG